MKKRLTCLMLSLMMVITLLPTSALADELKNDPTQVTDQGEPQADPAPAADPEPEQQQPGEGSGEAQQPGEGSGEAQQPGEGSGEGQQPGEGSGESQQPGEGTGEGQQPGEGTGEGEQPGEGTGEGQQPGEGTGDAEQPGEGTGDAEQQEQSDEDKPDLTADRESDETWANSVAKAKLTGDWAKDLVAVARTQLGYTASDRNYIVTEDGHRKLYTRYGTWAGDSYGNWCAAFVAFCVKFAKVGMPWATSCQNFVREGGHALGHELPELQGCAGGQGPVPCRRRV